jgi:hypothetical protein
MTKLHKAPIHKFQYDKSVGYNQICLTEIFLDSDYRKLNPAIELLAYQSSDAIGHPKCGIDYVILFEFAKKYVGEYWCHVSKAFFKLNKIEINYNK